MNENERFEKILEKVQKAPRYTGGEMNTAVKKWDDCPLHFGFCFPDTYEVGMSHLGLKILYGLINRCFPWKAATRCMNLMWSGLRFSMR